MVKILFTIFLILSFLPPIGTIQAAGNTLYVVSSGGATSGTCTSSAPCTLTRALTAVTAGDTIILNPGNYSGILILNSSNHQNITITTTPEVIAALGTFNRGIPSGTDNRPFFTNGRADVSVPGVRISYLRFDNGNRRDGDYSGIIGVSATNVTIDHNELKDGNQGVQVNVKRQVTISQNYIHSLGSMTSSEDTHGVAIVGSGTGAIGFGEAININNNTITDAGGDAVQEATNCYGSGTFSFLIMDSNNMFGNQEQAFDAKGTRDIQFSNNDVHDNGYGGMSATTPEDCRSVSSMDRWDIYNNKFHDMTEGAIYWSNGENNCSDWHIYNNLIYRTVTAPEFNSPSVQLCGDAGSKAYHNVFYNNTDSGSRHTGAIKDWGSGAGIVNNIFYNNGIGGDDHGAIWAISGEDSGTPSYNYIYPGSGSCNSGIGCKTGTNAVSTCFASGNCPGFVNISSYDFRLQEGSPAIDTGTNLSAPYNIDYAGATRPQGSAPDTGAFEFSGSGGGSTPIVGDINLDHIVNSIDYSILNADWFSSNARSDLNKDGLVNAIDYSLLNNNWFKTW